MPHGFFPAALVLAGILALATFAGCDRAPSAPAAGNPATSAPAGSPVNATPLGGQVAERIGLGQLSGRTYTHPHFKLSLTIPEGWYIQTKSESDQLVRTGTSMVKDPSMRAAAESAQQRTLNLLSAFRHPLGTPVPVNENLILTAENVAMLPGIKGGEDYLKIVEQQLRHGMAMKYETDPIEGGFKIGSYPAGRIMTHTEILGQQITQELYATRAGDYVLLVALSYGNDEQWEALQAILDSLTAG